MSSEKCREIFPEPILAVTYASLSVGNEPFSMEVENSNKKNLLVSKRCSYLELSSPELVSIVLVFASTFGGGEGFGPAP